MGGEAEYGRVRATNVLEHIRSMLYELTEPIRLHREVSNAGPDHTLLERDLLPEYFFSFLEASVIG